jgi:hypothetical protein
MGLEDRGGATVYAVDTITKELSMKRCCIAVLFALTGCQTALDPEPEQGEAVQAGGGFVCPSAPISCNALQMPLNNYAGAPFNNANAKQAWVVTQDAAGTVARRIDAGAGKVVEAWLIPVGKLGMAYSDLSLRGIMISPRPPLPPPPPIIDPDKYAVEAGRIVIQDIPTEAGLLASSCP